METGQRAASLDPVYFVWDASIVDFEAAYTEVAEAGVRRIVIDAKRGDLDMQVREDVAKAKRVLERLGLSAPACHGLCAGNCHPTEEDPEKRACMVRDHLRFMENAAELGALTYVMHLGFGNWDQGGAKRAGWDRVRRALDEWAPRAQSLGMKLALENSFTPAYLAGNAEELAAFVAAYGHPAVGVCYDSGHANIAGGAAPVLETLAPHVVTVHLHDNDGKQDQHLIPGQGTIVWPAVVPILDRCPRLVHVETEAANSKAWQFTREVWSVRDVYARYREILNGPRCG